MSLVISVLMLLYLPLLPERSARVVHLDLSVCVSGRVTQKPLLRFTRFFTEEILCLWLGSPLR